MSVVIERQDADTLRGLNGTCWGIYLDGLCYEFAIALHQGLGWDLIGLRHNDMFRHAAVRSPDGRLHDSRGFVSEEEFGRPFSIEPPYALGIITSSQLDSLARPVIQHEITGARRVAESMWPELPWIDSLVSRISAFASDLETLSRRHGLWIRSPHPTAKPQIAIGDGEEEGYRIQPLIDGISWTIDRHF